MFIDYESMHSELIDTSVGGFYKFGKKTYYEFGAGVLSRKLGNLSSTGVKAHAQYGFMVTNSISLSVSLIYKKLLSGDLEKRSLLDALPFVGYEVQL